MQCQHGLSAATMQHSWHTHAPTPAQCLLNAAPGIVPMQSLLWGTAMGASGPTACCRCISSLTVSRPPMRSGMAAHAPQVSLC